MGMTNEEAIEELSVLWERMKRAKENGVLAYKTVMFYDGQYVESLDLAIKALEQEFVIDKIRAEIENHCGLTKENHCRYCSYCNSVMGVREILEIIDKYIEGSDSE